MNDLKKQLSGMISVYCDEFKSTDISGYEDFEFSDGFERRMNRLLKSRKKVYYPLIKTTGRKIASLIAAALLMGAVTVAAYEPARNAVRDFIINIFSDHSVVLYAEAAEDGQAAKIMHEYSLTVPEGYVFDENESEITEHYIYKKYYSQDGTGVLTFYQIIENSYKGYFDNEYTVFERKKDKNGEEIIVSKADDYICVIWQDDQYVFELSGSMTESEIMDIYYSVE